MTYICVDYLLHKLNLIKFNQYHWQSKKNKKLILNWTNYKLVTFICLAYILPLIHDICIRNCSFERDYYIGATKGLSSHIGLCAPWYEFFNNINKSGFCKSDWPYEESKVAEQKTKKNIPKQIWTFWNSGRISEKVIHKILQTGDTESL